jgi:hypothetical protein
VKLVAVGHADERSEVWVYLKLVPLQHVLEY